MILAISERFDSEPFAYSNALLRNVPDEDEDDDEDDDDSKKDDDEAENDEGYSE